MFANVLFQGGIVIFKRLSKFFHSDQMDDLSYCRGTRFRLTASTCISSSANSSYCKKRPSKGERGQPMAVHLHRFCPFGSCTFTCRGYVRRVQVFSGARFLLASPRIVHGVHPGRPCTDHKGDGRVRTATLRLHGNALRPVFVIVQRSKRASHRGRGPQGRNEHAIGGADHKDSLVTVRTTNDIAGTRCDPRLSSSKGRTEHAMGARATRTAG